MAVCQYPQAKLVARQLVAVSLLGQRVQEGVGGRVVGLPGGAQDPRRRGEQHERGQVLVVGELVQIPGGVGFGGQHGVELIGGQLGDHGVIKDTGGVDDRGQRLAGGDGVQHRGQLGGVGGIAGADGDLGAQPGQPLVQFCGTRGGRAATRDQQQMPHAVAGDQMLGENPAQHPGAPGDQHRALGIEHRRGRSAQFFRYGGPWLMSRKACRACSQAVTGGGQRLKDTGGEQLGQGGPCRAAAARVLQLPRS